MSISFRTAFLVIGILLSILLASCDLSADTGSSSAAPVAPTGASEYPVTVTNYDAAENSAAYTYHKPPSRVVITHPGATELLLELGLEDHILATVAPYGAPLGDIAAKYKKLNILQARYAPSQEELLLMQPDMLIGWQHQFTPNELGEVSVWQKRGVGTFIVPGSLSRGKPTVETAVYDYINDMGIIFHIKEKTDDYIRSLQRRIDRIEGMTHNIPQKKTVLVLQSYGNGKFSLYDSRYLINTMIEKAGGLNLCQTPASFVGAEKVLAFDPDFIIFVSSSMADPSQDITDDEAKKQLQSVKELQHMRAIQAGNIINLSYFTVNNGGVRIANAIEKIARELYPERFQQNS